MNNVNFHKPVSVKTATNIFICFRMSGFYTTKTPDDDSDGEVFIWIGFLHSWPVCLYAAAGRVFEQTSQELQMLFSVTLCQLGVRGNQVWGDCPNF